MESENKRPQTTIENKEYTETLDRKVALNLPDNDFRQLISSADKFFKIFEDCPGVIALSSIDHRADTADVGLHTHKVMLKLDTEDLEFSENETIEGTSLPIREALRLIMLYHDLDKVIQKQNPELTEHESKLKALDQAISEISTINPELLANKEDRKVFELLFKSCDYFGYNVPHLNKMRPEDFAKILQVKLVKPAEKLEEEGVELDWEQILELQFRMSLADSQGIEAFKKNGHLIKEVYKKLDAAFSLV